MTISFDLEWNAEHIDVIGLAQDTRATAVERTPETLAHFLSVLHRADRIVGQNIIDADYRQLEREGIDTAAFLPKTFDIRLAMHATHSHLAGTGSYDLRSILLLLGARQGERFPLDWKQYESDLYRTCAFDAASALWAVPTLDRLIAQQRVEPVVTISHRCAPIFALMKEQGVRLDTNVLDTIYTERKQRLEHAVERYGLWEERGKKVIKRVPIWRSPKVLDLYEQKFGVRPKNLQRKTWEGLVKTGPTAEAQEFAATLVELGKGANDAHWLGRVEETEDGLDFEKIQGGRIYPRYDICGSPDRAIASSPNIQNFPRPSEDPRAMPLRSAIVPLEEGHVILGVDFSSIETLTNAIESDDWDRVRATLAGKITHEGTAALLNDTFGLRLNRQQGKAVNHGFDKGESPYNLARTLFGSERPSRQQTQQCQAIFWRMLQDYPKTAKFRDELWERSIENPLTVQNRFGRRLACFSRAKYGDASERYAKHNPEKKYWCSCSACAPRRDRWKYAIAFLGRSSAFDVLLRKMATIWEEQRLDAYSLPMVECHDELLFSLPRESAERYMTVAKQTFEEPVDELDGICLPSNAVLGDSWATAH